jgi:hypothetical protein
MPPHKYRSLVDPWGCSRIVSIAEVDGRHAALVAPAKSGESRRPSAHRVRAKTMSEAAPRRPNRGSSGGRRKRAELARNRPVDLSMEGALGSQPRGVGAPREDGSSAPRFPAHFGGRCRGATGSVSVTSARLVECRKSTHGSAARKTRRSPQLKGERAKRNVAGARDAQSRHRLGPDVLATASRRRRRSRRFQRV